jgi:hypothetical protein
MKIKKSDPILKNLTLDDESSLERSPVNRRLDAKCGFRAQFRMISPGPLTSLRTAMNWSHNATQNLGRQRTRQLIAVKWLPQIAVRFVLRVVTRIVER